MTSSVLEQQPEKPRVKDRELLAEVIRFLKSITKEDKVAVIHHTDSDGICSGVIVHSLVEKLRGKAPDLRHNQKGNEHSITKKTIEILKAHDINTVIITDIAPDEDVESLRNVAAFADVLVLDHHKIYTEFIGERVVLAKPHMVFEDVDPAKYSCSKFVYDIAQGIVDMSERDWVACAGAIGDMTTVAWRAFIRDVHIKYHAVLEENPFDSLIGQVAVYLTDAEAYDPQLVGKCFQIVYKATKPEDVLHSELHAYHLKVKQELEYWLHQVEEKADVYPNLIMYPLQPKYNIKSALSTILATRYPNYVLVLYSVINDRVYISMRSSDYAVRVNDLIEEATRDLPESNAGGHIPAAGGSIRKQDLDIFRQRILDLVEQGNFNNN